MIKIIFSKETKKKLNKINWLEIIIFTGGVLFAVLSTYYFCLYAYK